LGGRLEGLVQLVRSGLTPEKLPAPPPAPPPAPHRESLARRLFAPEPLPEAPATPPRPRVSVLSVLFTRETLPLEPERKRRHHDWLAFLFAPERLDPPGGPGQEVP
jgi:hypothetical protein